jgi:hypothetical protein
MSDLQSIEEKKRELERQELELRERELAVKKKKVEQAEEGIFDLWEEFGTDQKKETEGVWMHLSDKSAIKIAYSGRTNSKFTVEMAKAATKKAKAQKGFRQSKLGSISEKDFELGQKETMEVYCKAIVTDWRGILDQDKKPIECTLENRIWLFSNLPHLFDIVVSFSNNVDNYKDVEDEVFVESDVEDLFEKE